MRQIPDRITLFNLANTNVIRTFDTPVISVNF
jgi:hypothetical protein